MAPKPNRVFEQTTYVRRHFAKTFDLAKQGTATIIMNHNRPQAVVVGIDRYAALDFVLRYAASEEILEIMDQDLSPKDARKALIELMLKSVNEQAEPSQK